MKTQKTPKNWSPTIYHGSGVEEADKLVALRVLKGEQKLEDLVPSQKERVIGILEYKRYKRIFNS